MLTLSPKVDAYHGGETLRYEVLKMFPFGSKRPRLIKLSVIGIHNCHMNGTSTSLHSYASVLGVTAKEREHEYNYETDRASEISEEIASRVAECKSSLRRGVITKVSGNFMKALMIVHKYEEEKHPIRSRHRAKSVQENMLKGQLQSIITSLLNKPQTLEQFTINSFIKHFPSQLSKDCKMAVSNCRELMDRLKDTLRRTQPDVFDQELASLQQTSQEELDSIWERCIEQFLVLPVHEHIIQALRSYTTDSDETIEEKKKTLRELPKAYFGIPSYCAQTEDIDWSRVVSFFNDLSRKSLPIEKLESIIKMCRITFEMMCSIKEKERKAPVGVSADEFLPVIIYGIVQSNLTELETLIEYLYGLIPSDYLSGESGYYLTAFASAVYYLRDLSISDFRAEGLRMSR
ncbi:hypothetical protein PROFUN_04998 [Planoprotostelium fungivorum]|uniref:VPS9 domain-containing protein n=1 Tax=Planoprotostelium fungivorum TaxID=1890364 RepID=A0A2P6NSU1_9EUKA|nr:hypothetical protein PROFUN_04998 [Planoprotostelium fungivorum]